MSLPLFYIHLMLMQTTRHRHARGVGYDQRNGAHILGFEVLHIGLAGAARHHRGFRGERLQQVETALIAFRGVQVCIESRTAAGNIGAQRQCHSGADGNRDCPSARILAASVPVRKPPK